MSLESSTSRAIDRVMPWLVFGAALALYLVTLSPVAFPGESATLLASYSGVTPFLPLTHPLWALVIALIDKLPLGSFVVRANVFSAICGAGAVALMYSIVAQIDHRRTTEESFTRFRGDVVKRLSGLLGAALLAVATPMWLISTRAHTATFDILMLLASFWFAMRFWRTKKFSMLVVSALIYGLGIAEFATFILLLPLYVTIVLVMLGKSSMLSWSRVLKLAACASIGIALYLLHAWRFAETPAYQWREFKSYWHIVGQMFKDQYHLIVHGVPKVGWLTISIVSFVPWLIVFFLRAPKGRSTDRGASMGSTLLSLVITILGVVIYLNTLLSPWAITEQSPLLITPYLFIAMWMGYLAGYWYVLLSREVRRGSAFAKSIRKTLKLALVPLLLAFVGVAGWKSYEVADGRPAAAIQRFVQAVLEEMGDRTWLISNGVIDNHVLLESKADNTSIKVLNTAPAGGATAYSKYIASLFTDVRRQSLARVGLAALLNDWFSSDTNAFSEVAVLTQSDYWFASGGEPLPRRVVFTGIPTEAPVDYEALLRDHQALWKTLVPDLKTVAASRNPSAPWCSWALNHFGKVANNLGVFLEERGQTESAFAAYQEARQIDTNNLSALLNAYGLSKREKLPEYSGIEKELQLRAKKMQVRFRVWSLSHYFGYVRSPETYAARGWAWAMTGKRNLAISDMQRALKAGDDRPQMQLAMANLYFSQDMDAQSEAAYLEVLKKDPSNRPALLGMSRIAARKGDLDEARVYLAKLEELKASKNMLRMERAVVESLAGNPAAAIAYLRDVLKDEPDNMAAWAAIATIARESDDNAVLEEALTKLESAQVLMPGVRLAVAKLALVRNDRATARRHLSELLRYQPGHIEALEILLRLDVREGQKDFAEAHVEQLLASDPRNAIGNYILGTLQVFREQYALAESSFRTSLLSNRSPDTLNDLAWVLHRRGANDEALVFVKEALRIDRNHRTAWDTFGAILLAAGDLPGAEKALQQAIALQPDSAEVLFHMTMLYEKKGQRNEALKLADGLLTRPAELSRESYDELREIVKRLRGTSG